MAGAALVLLAALAPTPALAGPPSDGGIGLNNGHGKAGSGAGGGTTVTGNNTSAQVGGCHLYAGTGGFGEACLGSGSSSHLSVKQILGTDPVPTCSPDRGWDVPLTDAELAQLETNEQYLDLQHFDYYWHRCLNGISADYKITWPVTVTSQLHPIPKGTPPKTLTHNQQKLVHYYASGSNDYPIATAVASPSVRVRTNEDVAFHAVPDSSDQVAVGGVVMQARITHLTVAPLGPDGPSVGCDGAGLTVSPSDTPDSTAPGAACWYAFTHSSAGQPDDKYPMRVTATWAVRYTTDPATPWSSWTLLNDNIQVTSTTNQTVNDIQTLIIN
jgi:hypothetical protein